MKKIQLKVENKQPQIKQDHEKLLLTMILKDDSEYDMLHRCLTSFMPYFDGLCVAITGVSRENKRIKSLIKKYKGEYIETNPQTHPKLYSKDKDGYFFSNFAEARNVSFALAQEMQEKYSYDWWSWADVDDILIEGHELQKAALIGKREKLDAVYFTYWYAVILREDGTFGPDSVEIDHIRERLLRPGLWKWVSHLHEVCIPKDDNFKPIQSVYDYNEKEDRMCTWVHLTVPERTLASKDRNIRILEAQRKAELAEGKDDPRTVFYLAKSYFDNATKKEDFELADHLLNEYLETSGWAEERASAWEYKAQIRGKAGDHRAAIDCLHNSLKEYGNRHMPILLLAQEYAEVGDFEQSDFWLDVVTRMDEPKPRTTIGNPLQIKFLAASLKYNQAARRTKINDMLEWMERRHALVKAPGDEDLLNVLREGKLQNDACSWVWQYAKWLKDHGHKERIKPLIASMPLELGRELFAHQIANEVVEPRVWGEKEIAFYASWGTEHFEGWSPKNMDTGIGGSETAVIELARRWVKMGYTVTVFGDPRDDEGDYEGVTYKPYYAMNWNDTFNILILWRSPHLLDKPIKAKKIYMDLHDVASQLDWNEDRMKKIDKVFFKSKFHRNMIPKLPDKKAIIISNGL